MRRTTARRATRRAGPRCRGRRSLPWQRAAAAPTLLARRAALAARAADHRPRGASASARSRSTSRRRCCARRRAPDGLAVRRCAPAAATSRAGQHPDLRVVEPIEIDEDGDVEAGRMDRRRPRPRADRLGAAHEPSPAGEGRRHRAGRADERRGGERAAEDARGAAGRHVPDPRRRDQPGGLPATVRSRCRRVRRAAARPTRAGVAWLVAQGVARCRRALLAQAGGAPLAALALADPRLSGRARGLAEALARRDALSPTALGARIDAAPREDERQSGSPRVIDWLSAGAPTSRASRRAARRAATPDFAARAGGAGAVGGAVAAVSLSSRRCCANARSLAHPLQPRLVAEALLTDYRALFG